MNIFGFVFERLYRSFYAKVPLVGELWVDAATVVRGRWWIDYLKEGNSLDLFFGGTHVVLSPHRWMLRVVGRREVVPAPQLPA